MAYAFVQTLHGMTEEDYGRVAAAVRGACGGRAPDGLVAHVAGPVADGYRYLDVWESEEAWNRFHEDVLHPALTGIGFLPGVAARIEVEREQLDRVHDLWTPDRDALAAAAG
jgi:hypothetical protein